jgi:hypothetical protein
MRLRSIHMAALGFAMAFAASSVLAADTNNAEIPSGAQLTATIAAQDSAIFQAYNQCDLNTFARYIAPDIEFYHDKGGVTLGRAKMVESIKNGICGKLRRELVAGSMEVYPIKGYGAVEMGAHRFCDVSTGHCDGEARFVHLWKYHAGVWQLSRVISYDHHLQSQ